MWVAWTIFGVLLGIEALLAYVLFIWHDDLKYKEERIAAEKQTCFACLTGASVTSFNGKTEQFCVKHVAHWTLIHDLEEQQRKGLE